MIFNYDFGDLAKLGNDHPTKTCQVKHNPCTPMTLSFQIADFKFNLPISTENRFVNLMLAKIILYTILLAF